MEISFRFSESAARINVPVGGGFIINVNPIGGLSVNVHAPKLTETSANPKVFFDMAVDGEAAGRVVMELFADTTPRTAENFRALCTGEKGMGKLGKALHYKGSIFHEVGRKFTLSGGDFIEGNGTGGESIYTDRFFEDENFLRKHTGPGILSMCNPTWKGNGSQFMISMTEMTDYDDQFVVFGQVVQGLDVLTSIMDKAGTKNCCHMPSKPVVITHCGQIA